VSAPPGVEAAYSLARLTTIRTGGPADWFARVDSEERLAELLATLRPAPAAWVRAAQELPSGRRELDQIVARAQADAEYRKALIDDLEAALRGEGYEPELMPLDELRRRLTD
jgi:hypothetical protein